MKDELGNVFYVGKTNDPSHRFSRHLYHVKYGSTYPVHNKLRKVISVKGNRDNIYEIIESDIPEKDIDSREMHYIKFYRDKGYKLKNLTDGGEGGKGFSPEIYKRGAMKRMGVPRSVQTRRRISDSKKGIPLSVSHKKALQKAWELREPLSVEHYQRISQLNRGVINIKNFIVVSPDGTLHTTTRGLTDFCRENGLDARNLIHTKPNGTRKFHKGWKIVGEV